MSKQNCWEFTKCGREPDGSKVSELGECSAATDITNHGRHDGQNAGRYCWRVAGTFCNGQVQGDMAGKIMNCIQCDFFKAVKAEEGPLFSA